MDGRVIVVYIAGAGRSGSTLLDVALGSMAGAVGVGELNELQRSSWPRSELCSCGKQVPNCDFWREVWEEWVRNSGLRDVSSYGDLQRRYERPIFWLRLLFTRYRVSASFAAYARATGALYEAISKVSACNVVIESSKNPVRALALSRLTSIDLKLVHLIRDARGVAWSMSKSFSKDTKRGLQVDLKPRRPWRTVLDWILVNLQVDRVASLLDPKDVATLRYEDLVEDPRGALSRMSGLLGTDVTPLGNSLEAGEAIQIGHMVAGNRIRMHKRLKLGVDLAWRRNMSGASQKQCWRLAGWLLKRYGYTERGGD